METTNERIARVNRERKERKETKEEVRELGIYFPLCVVIFFVLVVMGMISNG